MGMLAGTCLSAAIEALQQAMSDLEDDCECSDPDWEADNDLNYEDDPYKDPPDDNKDGNVDHGDNGDAGDAGDDAGDHDDRGGKLASQRGGDQDLDSIVTGPQVSGFVVLACKPRKCVFCSLHIRNPIWPHVLSYTELCYPHWVAELATYINIPLLPFLISQFIFQQLNPDCDIPEDPALLPPCSPHIHVYHSTVTMFYAPSDPHGMAGMHHKHIQATPSWWKSPPRYDCVYVGSDPTELGFRSLLVAHVCLFFSFRLCIPSIDPDALQDMSCALVEWFLAVDDEPDEETGLWVVEPDLDVDGACVLDVIDARTIFFSVHLIPVFGGQPIPPYMKSSDALDSYRAYYVNRYTDHHAHEEIF